MISSSRQRRTAQEVRLSSRTTRAWGLIVGAFYEKIKRRHGRGRQYRRPLLLDGHPLAEVAAYLADPRTSISRSVSPP